MLHVIPNEKTDSQSKLMMCTLAWTTLINAVGYLISDTNMCSFFYVTLVYLCEAGTLPA